MKYFIMTFIYVIFNVVFTVYATEIKTSVQLIPESQEYHEGDIVEIDLKIWPIENADLEEFKKIEGSSLFNGLEITQLNTVEISENNADVVIVKATAVVVAPTSVSGVIQYKDQALNISAPLYNFLPLKTKQEDFFILDQSVISATSFLWIFFLVIGMLIVIFVLKKKFWKTKDTSLEFKKHYQDLFSSADERKDFEKIYALRKEWIPFLAAETNAHREFLKLMEAHQYRKEWTKDMAMEIKNTFDVIRGSFL